MKTGEVENSKTPGVRGDGQWTIGEGAKGASSKLQAPSSREAPKLQTPNSGIVARAESAGILPAGSQPDRLKPELQLQPTDRLKPELQTNDEPQSVALLPVQAIAPSKTNPRRTFDPARLQELAESVKRHGVLQPILLRPIGPWAKVLLASAELLEAARKIKPGEKMFEIVAGERRWRAATLAGLAEVPAIVRVMDDKSVLEVQVIENLQRDDLSPIEEADGYERLIKQHGYTAAAIAEKIGKSKEYVYARVKLTALCPAGRAALAQGHLTTEVALLLARLPSQNLQEEVLEEEAITGNEHEGPMPVKKVRELLHREYMLHLKTATWDLKDATLHPPAGPCSSCPKRTINARELFPDVGNADVCTDPPCFKKKREAWGTRQLAAARQAGQEVFDGQAAEKLFSTFPWEKNKLRDERFIDLSDRCEALGYDHKQHWKGTLGQACPKAIVAIDPEGKVRELLRRDDALQALKKRGLKPKAVPTTSRAQAKKRQRLAEIAKLAVTAALPKATSLALDTTSTRHKQFWRLMAQAAFAHAGINALDFVAKRRGLATSINDASGALEKWLKTDHDEPEEYEAFVIECMIGAQWSEGWSKPTFGKGFKEFCALAKVDLESLAKEKEQKGTKEAKGKRKSK